jgi:hypothetical protein
MKNHILPHVPRMAFDEAEAIVESLDEVDAALGKYLTCCLADPDLRSKHGPPVGSPPWYRARILEWCRSPHVRLEFDSDAVESTRLAVPELEDDELRLLVVDIVHRGAASAATAAAGCLTSGALSLTVRQTRQQRLHRRQR